MKRLLSFGAALMLTAALAGCSSTGDVSSVSSAVGTSPSSTAQSTTGGAPDSTGSGGTSTPGSSQATTAGKTTSGNKDTTTKAPGLNFNGYEFVLGTVYPDNYQPGGSTATELNNKFKELEDKYNVKITVKSYNPDSCTQQISNEVMAGGAVPNVLEVPITTARNLVVSDMLADMKGFSDIKLDNGNFLDWCTDSFTWGGKVYATATFYGGYLGVFFNNDLIKKNMPGTDIYKLYKDGKWTWDKMREIAIGNTKDTNGDRRTDLYGIAANSTIIGSAFNSSAGGTAIRQGDTIKAVMCDQAGIDALSYLKRLFKEDGVMKYVTNASDALNMFINETAAMFPFYLSWAPGELGPNVNFDMGFVPFPKPTESDKHNAVAYDMGVYAIPRTMKDKQQTGVILNELSAMGKVSESKYIESLRNAGLSEDGINVFKAMNSDVTMDYSLGPDFGSLNNQKIENCVIVSATQPAATINGIKTAMQKACDDYYGQFK